MRSFLFPALVIVLAVPSWKYYFQNDEKINHCKTNLLEEEKEGEIMNSMDQPAKNDTNQNPQDRLFIKPTFFIFSHDTVLVLLLIHTIGAERIGYICTVGCHMSSAGGLLELAISFIAVGCATYKLKREKAELVKENIQLKESLDREKDREDFVPILNEVKTKLDNQRHQLTLRLEEVEREREENKLKLRAVEEEITEKERTSDKPEELLREKERLLREQWKLDETKNNTQGQLLNIERLREPIEVKFT
ncbi:putative uncharacterized protein DDB_G0271982 [Dicentrarchus labrax]|uniref:putative uncharacterized protein DDB_G0271982 n=1 Tax=Dicentrarchus labrax TaxID=13489 RepID=UPI0021F6496D|nr:putative uncharacterized protein DDB_G0271982 [Dicentrarchus labrax]XP_051285373.1 putative uncharacterized protein DDB_G0271982 [Dicentrarchus labrax]